MSNYWQRRNEELKHIQAQFQTDADYNRELRRIYDSGQREIQKEVDSFLQNYAGRENLSMDEAIKKVDKMDVEAFRDKAQRYVEEKNFSPRANDELRAYNVKMRMNRQQLLNEHIRLETIAMANGEERLLTARLDDEVYEEMQRQAGILGETVPSPERIRELSKQIVAADFKGTNFSNRIWTGQSELQAGLENVMRRTIIRGENPRVAARSLRDLVNDNVGNAKAKAERIAITESARIQTQSQKASFDEYGIQQVEWVAEPDACDICDEQDGKIFDKSQMESDLTIPAHPNCRCSFAAVVDRNAWENDLRERGLLPDDGDGTSEDTRVQSEPSVDDFDSFREYRNRDSDTPTLTNEEIVNSLKNKHGIEFNKETKYDIDNVAMNEIIRFLDDFDAAFPNLTDNPDLKMPQLVLKNGNEMKRGSRAAFRYQVRNADGDYTGKVYGINLKGSEYKDVSNIIKAQKEGFASGWQTTDHVNHTFVHEYGHYVEHVLNREIGMTDGKPFYSSIIDEAIKERLGRDKYLPRHRYKLLSEEASEYGKTSEKELFAELFAEAFGTQENEPRELSKAFGRKLEEALKGVSRDN